MKIIQCTHLLKSGERCGNNRNVHPFVEAGTFTCEKHGAIRRMVEPTTNADRALEMGPGVYMASDLTPEPVKVENPNSIDAHVARLRAQGKHKAAEAFLRTVRATARRKGTYKTSFTSKPAMAPTASLEEQVAYLRSKGMDTAAQRLLDTAKAKEERNTTKA